MKVKAGSRKIIFSKCGTRMLVCGRDYIFIFDFETRTLLQTLSYDDIAEPNLNASKNNWHPYLKTFKDCVFQGLEIIHILTESRAVIKYDLANAKVINKFHFTCSVEGASFANAVGTDAEMTALLVANGAKP